MGGESGYEEEGKRDDSAYVSLRFLRAWRDERIGMGDAFLAQMLLRVVVACARDVSECTECSDGDHCESDGARVVLLRLGGRVAPGRDVVGERQGSETVKACSTNRLSWQCADAHSCGWQCKGGCDGRERGQEGRGLVKASTS